MKKIILSTILMTSLVACYKDEAILNEIPQDPLTKSKNYLSGDEYVKMKRHKITPTRALTIAQEAKVLFDDENEHLVRLRSIGLTLTPVAITSRVQTRSAGGIDTLMYVVNYSNNAGFVFVSNDDRDGEILMYAGDGNFAMQDTTDNPGLKLHVEMMLAYQKHKLNEIKSAEARGEKYVGGMITEEVTLEECLPNIQTAAKGSGAPSMPGNPGHICNLPGAGMPGEQGSPTREDVCAPRTYELKSWAGNNNAEALAKREYPNQRCFGIPVAPPTIHFAEGGEQGYLGQGQPCPSPPYCSPPLWNYGQYYNFYGCKMSMHLRTVVSQNMQPAPLLTTCWDQGKPLNRGLNAAGCGPIAMAQLMVYHNYPKGYGSQAFTGTHKTEIDSLRTLRTNTNITNSLYRHDAWKFLQEIRVRLNVTYQDGGSEEDLAPTSTSSGYKMKNIKDVFDSFGYYIGYNGIWDYHRDQNFGRVVESIQNGQPVYIEGSVKGGGNGHIWILDGYRTITNRYYYAEYYFDEYGDFNAENRYVDYVTREYVHANMGWGSHALVWVKRGAYDFAGTTYDKKLFYLAGIRPK